ncbi:Succinyl-CoA:3-ketoacid coenzyme A transferase 1, mitochondrial [Exophiala dermatitidis]
MSFLESTMRASSEASRCWRTARYFTRNKRQQNLMFARSFSSTLRRNEINKIVPSAAEAIKDLKSNSTLLCGGFGLCGVPDTLINEVAKTPSITGLTAVSNNAGIPGAGLGQLLESRQVKKMIASYVGENKVLEQMYLGGELELELTPQGTLAERCAAGGKGIPAFYTPAAFGTVVQTGEIPLRHNPDGTVAAFGKPRDVKVFNGKSYVMEEAIQGDYAFVKAYRADKLGNCQFRLAANNFNGAMGRNAKVTIVEAEHIVEVGEIDPVAVHLPGIYVSKVIQSTAEKKIEKYVNRKEEGEGGIKDSLGKGDTASKRERIVKRAAKEFQNGMYANLGIGMPMLAPSFVDPSVEVQLQSENGILGLGPYPKKGEEDPDLINAGKETVTLNPGASCFGSEESFGMIRSGRINMSMLGAMQVSARGDLANWMLPGKVKGFGGAMDLVSNPEKTKVVALMEHTDKKGNPKILKQCEFPLTGRACVSRIITELCVFDVDFTNGLTLIEVAEGVTVDEVKAKTEAPFKVADNLKTF